MPKFDKAQALACDYKVVAVNKSTATNNVSTPSDSIVGKDYLERVLVIANSTASPGVVTILDGDTTLITHNNQITAFLGNNIVTYEIGALANTTKGFNITTGTSMTALAIGRFG